MTQSHTLPHETGWQFSAGPNSVLYPLEEGIQKQSHISFLVGKRANRQLSELPSFENSETETKEKDL